MQNNRHQSSSGYSPFLDSSIAAARQGKPSSDLADSEIGSSSQGVPIHPHVSTNQTGISPTSSAGVSN